MNRTRTLAAIAVGTAAIAAPAALAAVSHVKIWENSKNSMICGLEIVAQGKQPNTVLCGAKGIPKPKGTPKTAPGDPMVQITKSGKPKLVLISQDSFVSNHSVFLSNGTTWSSVGVTCKVGPTVTCTNGSRHGFKIGNGKYKPF
jgi:hypothetical protein